MSDTQLLDAVNAPQTTYLHDYQVPSHLIEELNLHFDLNENDAIVRSTLILRRNPDSDNLRNTLVLHGEELILRSLKLDNQPLDTTQYELTDHTLVIHHVPETFTLEIVTQIFPQKNTALSGLYRSAQTFCTQCEAEGFRRITYFLDRPDVLTRYITTITADQTKYPILLSNGNIVDAGQLANGRHFVTWHDPFNKPSYLFALVAGDFDLLEDKFITQSGREISLRIYVDKGYGDQSHHAMYAVKQAMRWDEEKYGREYDLDIYMIVAIGDFNMGAMENKGLNIFNTKYILAKPNTATDDDYIHILSVVAHEYFHNWTGNRVTCRDWFQLSLKEGLTIFRDQSFSEDIISRAVMRIRDVVDLRETQFPEDASDLAHAVRPDSYIEINNFYTATIYNKGAEVLRMLQTILGKNLFRKAMDLYFARFDGKAVTIEDFIQTMEEVSQLDLKQFRLWYSQAGTPQLKVEDRYDAAKQVYHLTFTQTLNPTPGQSYKQAMTIPIRMGLLDKSGQAMSFSVRDDASQQNQQECVLLLTETSQTFYFDYISTRPLVSLLRNFSAPVKCEFNYSDDDLLFLFAHDVDEFNRWEAGQNYLVRLILKLVNSYQQRETWQMSQTLLDVYQQILQNQHQDPFLRAEMLTIPSEKYIGEQMAIVDVDAIHAAREFVMLEIAKQLQSIMHEVYKQSPVLHSAHFNIQDIGTRQLKNRCLFYLTQLANYHHLALHQFESSLEVNMTESLAALAALVNSDSKQRTEVLMDFYTVWQHDALVLDKWFAIQAISQFTSIDTIKSLSAHPGFDIKNPNKVYALIGAFANRNLIHFHDKTGSGYEFLGEMVQQLDQLNPQIAARMVKPLTAWKRYDKERASLMRKQLELLVQRKLSSDVYELVTKSLI